MGFNYRKEKERFDREWARLRKEYLQAGMSEAAIQEMYEFDWSAFCAQRTYTNRVQRLPDDLRSDTDEAERTRLLRKYKSLAVAFEDELTAHGKNWIGYELRGGKMCLQPEEANTVQWIFAQYVAGFSYAKLTEALNRRGIPYLPDKPWNKNMVARMLEDRRYAGTEGYPAIVDGEQMEAALRHRIGRSAVPKLDEEIKEIRRLAVCGLCGEKMRRIPHVHGRERWSCPTCKGIPRAVTDSMLSENVMTALKHLIASPSVVRVPNSAAVADHAADAMEQELERRMTLSDSEESSLTQMAFQLAVLRYVQLDSGDYETQRIRRCLEKAAPSGDVDITLLHSITDAVLVHPSGAVQLRLKNDQVI